LVPVVPYRAAIHAEPQDKLRIFSETLLDSGRSPWHRLGAAEALGRLRTQEAVAALDHALALADLDANLRSAVEKAIDEALSRSSQEQ